jgi:diguanylate cyclase (GGDEF)-like protein
LLTENSFPNGTEDVAVSWLIEQFDRFLSLADGAVAGGYVLALGLICVLQYMLHVYRLSEASRESERRRDEVKTLQSDFRSAQWDRTLSRLENSILREFVALSGIDKSLELLMRRFVPNCDTGFGVFLQCSVADGQQYGVRHSRGLSGESREQLRVDDDLLRKVVRERVLVLTVAELQSSTLLRSLSATDRRKVSRLNLVAVGDGNQMAGILITTSLYPPGAPQEQQIELIRRLMQSISTNFKRSQTVEKQMQELRTTSEMLDLRLIADQQFDTPLTMIREFLFQLMQKLEADRVSLYLVKKNSDTPCKPLVRSGIELEPGARACWQAFEDRLTKRHLKESQLTAYCQPDLQAVGIEAMIGGAIVAPLVQKQGTIGFVCFTKRNDEPFTAPQISLVTWAAEYLADMILRELNQAMVQREAREDGLTELANRRSFDQQIKQQVRLAEEQGQEVSLLLFDLDRFKAINDTFGHQAGDMVLRNTAQLLKDEALTLVRADDRVVVARYGGEEMVVLLHGVDTIRATEIGESIRAAVETATFRFGREKISVTVSVGVATFPGHAANVAGLISAADNALYHAKQAGRNRVVTADRCPVEQTPAVESRVEGPESRAENRLAQVSGPSTESISDLQCLEN